MGWRGIPYHMSPMWKPLLKQGFSWSWRFGYTGGPVSVYTYFSDEEVKGLDRELCAMLDRARSIAGVAFLITNGFRTPDQNAALLESVKDSAHLTGNAVDLSCNDSQIRFKMLTGLIHAGFARIGIYEEHIHVDNSPSLPPNVCWYVRGT